MSDTKGCPHVSYDLIPLFPDDLDPAEAALVREHVAACNGCAAELGIYVAQAARFGAAREGRSSQVQLWDGIQKKLAQPAPAGRLLSLPVATAHVRAGIAAAVALAVGLGLLAFGRTSERTSEKETPRPSPVETANNFAKKEPTAPPARRRHAPRPRLPRLEFEDGGDFHVADQRDYVAVEPAEVPGGNKGYRHSEAEVAPTEKPGRSF